MDDPTSASPPPDDLPPPLVGCLVCHTEGSVTQQEGRTLPILGEQSPTIHCSHCDAIALFDQPRPNHWRIRYKSLPDGYLYNFAKGKFGSAGWVDDNDALDISTEIYIQRQRLMQTVDGKLDWLKPERLNPPPPLMDRTELVYLTLKPVSFCETSVDSRVPAFLRNNINPVLDTGVLYVTDKKIHLLGQGKDRSHQLVDIQGVDYQQDQWFVFLMIGEQRHHYQGYGMNGLDAELIAATIDALSKQAIGQ